jgi:hypothetical protein
VQGDHYVMAHPDRSLDRFSWSEEDEEGLTWTELEEDA